MYFLEFIIYLVLGTFGFLFTSFLFSLDRDEQKNIKTDILLLVSIFYAFLFSMILWFIYEMIN